MRLRRLRLRGPQLASEEGAPRPQPLLESGVLRGEGGVAVRLALGRRQLWLKALTMSAHQPSKVPLNLWGRGAHYKYITTTTATKASGKQADEYSC